MTVTRFVEPPRNPPIPLRLHRSVRTELIGAQNEGFLEGVCHTIDELHAAGFIEAAEAMMARLFLPAGEVR